VRSVEVGGALHTLHAAGRKHASLGGGVLPCAGSTGLGLGLGVG
jgi:hypothetical protein